jgi:hypothetical protein
MPTMTKAQKRKIDPAGIYKKVYKQFQIIARKTDTQQQEQWFL